MRVCRVSESSLRVIKSRDVRGEPGRAEESRGEPGRARERQGETNTCSSVSNALCLLSNLVVSIHIHHKYTYHKY